MGNARFDFFHPLLQLGAGKVAVAVVHRLELAAVDSNQVFREKTQLLAKQQMSSSARMALLLSLRKLAMVLKSGFKRPVSHISSTLRCASRSRRRLDWMRRDNRRCRSSAAPCRVRTPGRPVAAGVNPFIALHRDVRPAWVPAPGNKCNNTTYTGKLQHLAAIHVVGVRNSIAPDM